MSCIQPKLLKVLMSSISGTHLGYSKQPGGGGGTGGLGGSVAPNAETAGEAMVPERKSDVGTRLGPGNPS